ncbi:ATP-binding protein [Lentzea nigeriaca]
MHRKPGGTCDSLFHRASRVCPGLGPEQRCDTTTRRSVRQALSHLDTDCVEDAELLVTELVSNAYDHGQPPISLRLCHLPNSLLHIDVEDGDRTHLPRLRVSGVAGERGRGLVLVDQLSRGWGFNVTTTSKVVWAEMNCRASR